MELVPPNKEKDWFRISSDHYLVCCLQHWRVKFWARLSCWSLDENLKKILWSTFWGRCLVEIMKLKLLSLWSWIMIKIYQWTCDKTEIYSGKCTQPLGPLCLWQCSRDITAVFINWLYWQILRWLCCVMFSQNIPDNLKSMMWVWSFA